MKLDAGRTIIWGTGLWLYTLLVVGLSEIGEISFAVVLLSYIPLVALYVWMVARENKKLTPDELAARKPQGLIGLRQRQYTRRDMAESMIAIFGAVILAVLTVAFVTRPDMGLELTESIKLSRITCNRDTSKITTLPVNKTVELDGTKIAVHNVTYNVPGQNEHPVEFPDKYHCAKATLVEITVDRPEAITYKGAREISLTHKGSADSKPPRYYGIDDYSNYLEGRQLTVLNDDDFTFETDAYQKHGWLLFRLPQEYSNANNFLVYKVHKYTTDAPSSVEQVSIALPSQKN